MVSFCSSNPALDYNKRKFIGTLYPKNFSIEICRHTTKLDLNTKSFLGLYSVGKLLSPWIWILFNNGFIEGKPIYYALVHYHISLLVGMAVWSCIWTGW